MKSEQAIKNMDQIITQTVGEFGIVMLQVAETANTLLKKRIVETGYNAEGAKFDPYSTKPMLTNRSAMTGAVYSQVAGSKEKRKDLKWVTLQRGGKSTRLFELAGGYKEFRDLHGRQTGFVDFAFSGRMWSSVQVVSSEAEHQKGLARISTLSDEEMKKLEGNTERKGTILDLNDEEVAQISKIMEDWLVQKWNTLK